MKLSLSRREMFIKVTQAHGVSGYESEISKVLKSYYEGYCDEIIYDNLGSIYAVKKSKTKNPVRVMVAAHMDEVGFRVGKINGDGTLKFSNVPSGIWEQVVMTSRLTIKTQTGEHIPGVVNAIAPHRLTPELRAKPLPVNMMIVDVGCSSADEVKKLGINIGDTVVLDGEFVELNGGKRLLSKAFDNRYGCLMTIEALKALKGVELPYDLYIGADVQEEVGCRGAQTAANMIKPDFAIILDCSPAMDTSGDASGSGDGLGHLGQGVLNRFGDGSFIAFPQLLAWQREMCDKCNVPYQYFSSTGGTDAGLIHKSNAGVLTLTHCICARNIHTSGSIIDLGDYDGAQKVLVAMLRALSAKQIEQFKESSR